MVWNPITFSSPVLCSKCNNHTIEIYDYFGNPLGYERVLNRKEMHLDSDLDAKAVYEMKCRKCGAKYNIIWENDYPYPDLRTIPLSQQFIKLFKKGV